jgi:hypothetical protein
MWHGWTLWLVVVGSVAPYVTVCATNQGIRESRVKDSAGDGEHGRTGVKTWVETLVW